VTEYYREALVEGPFEPLAVVPHLVRSGFAAEYVVYERDGRWFVAGDPLTEILIDGSGDPWARMKAALDQVPVEGWNAYGWISFELGDSSAVTDQTLGHLMIPRVEFRIGADQVLVRAVDEGVLDAACKLLRDPIVLPESVAVPIDVRVDQQAYRAGVAHAVEEICAGRLHKVILSRTVPVPFEVDMCATYVEGRRHNTPARSFLLDFGGWQAAGFSPETVVEVDAAGRVSTQPLAGTRALTGDAGADAGLRAELLGDPKEVFEHATSVKLAFEELASVGDDTQVSEFLAIKPRGSVQHLASRVGSTLRAGHTAWDALGAVFPPVTASGIPKPAAYELIRQLETEPRGLYAGAVLMAGSDGSLDAALVLRAIYQRDGQAWLRAGAGIVSASRPAREYEETCEKLASVAPYVVPVPDQPVREGEA
jgi:salicylate synthetase